MCHMKSSKISRKRIIILLPTLNSIPPSPHPQVTHTRTHTHTHEKETGSGWHVQINQKAWQKKCDFRITLKVGREGEALRSASSEFQTIGAM